MTEKIGLEAVFQDADFRRGLANYLKGLDQAGKKTTETTKQSGQSFTGFNKILGSIGAGFSMYAVYSQVQRFVADSLVEFGKFDKGIREVFTLLPDLSQAAMMQMESDVITLAKEVGRIPNEIVPALYQSISAGVPKENVFEFLRTANEAALGGVTSLEIAVDGITSVVNAYGVETVNAAQASDLMFTAVKGGKTTFEELSNRLFQVVPIAASVGIEFGNITAGMATLTAVGVPTRVAATQLRALLVELSDEAGDAGKMFKELAGVGFVEFIEQGNNLQDAIQLMESGASDMGLTLRDVFGSIEATGAALGLTGASTEKFTAELAAAENSAGATAQAAATMGESLAQVEGRAAAAGSALKIAIGEGLEPSKRAWLELKIQILDATAALVSARQEAAKVVEQTKTTTGSFGDLRAEGRRMVETLSGMGQLRGTLANITGASRPLHERMAEIAVEVAQTSENMDQFNARLQDTFDGFVEVDEVTGTYSVHSKELGYIVLGTTDAFQQELGMMEALRAGQQLATADAAMLATAKREVAAASGDVTTAVTGQSEALLIEKSTIEGLAGAWTGLMETGGELGEVIGALAEQYGAANEELTLGETIVQMVNDAYDEQLAMQDQINEKLEEHRAALAEAQAAQEAFAQATGEYFDSALTATDQTTNWNSVLYEMGASAGLSAEQLAILAASTGEFTEQQIEAAFQAALMQANIQSLVDAISSGEITTRQAVDALTYLESGQASTAAEAIGLHEAEMRASAAAEQMSGVMTEAGVALEDVASGSVDAADALTVALTAEQEAAIAAAELAAEQQAAGQSAQEMAYIMNDAGEDILGLQDDATETAEGIAKAFDKDWQGVGTSISGGIAAGIEAGAGAAIAAAAGVAAAAIGAAQSELVAYSPSRRAAAEVGEPFSHGVAVGITRSMGVVEDAVERGIDDSLRRGGDFLQDGLAGIADALELGVRETIEQGLDFGRIGAGFADFAIDPLEGRLDELDDTLDPFTKIAKDAGFDELSDFLKAIQLFPGAFGGQIKDVNYLLQKSGMTYDDILGLSQERLDVQEQLTAEQERLLKLQEQQQQLEFLQQQLDLIDMLEEAGLDAGTVLAGIPLGIDADPSVLVDAMTTALTALLGDATANFPEFQGGGYTGNVPQSMVAGVVHGGEYVFSKQAVDRLGLAFLDGLNQQAGMLRNSLATAASPVVNVQGGTSKAYNLSMQTSRSEAPLVHAFRLMEMLDG